MESRRAHVAGYFYPSNKKDLDNLLDSISENEKIDYEYAKKNIIGGVIPHAGYIYSAPEAIHFFELVKKSKIIFDTIVIINPNHTGLGHELSLSGYKYWDTPYGKVEVDLEFQNLLQIKVDDSAHSKEHSGEVMLPLLKKYLDYPFKIVPICFKHQNYVYAKLIADKLHDAVRLSNKKILVIASSDFSHYIEAREGKELDDIALNEIEKFDSKNLEKEIYKNNMSICGFGPIMVLMEYCKLLSTSPKSTILKRGNSGDITGDYSKVVNYNCILFFEER